MLRSKSSLRIVSCNITLGRFDTASQDRNPTFETNIAARKGWFSGSIILRKNRELWSLAVSLYEGFSISCETSRRDFLSKCSICKLLWFIICHVYFTNWSYCYGIIYNNSLIVTKIVISGCNLNISHCNEICSLYTISLYKVDSNLPTTVCLSLRIK